MKCLKFFVLFLLLCVFSGCSTTSASKVLYESAQEEITAARDMVKELPEVCYPKELDDRLFSIQQKIVLYRDYQESQLADATAKVSKFRLTNGILLIALGALIALLIRK